METPARPPLSMEMNAVALKLPASWPDNPRKWFLYCEGKFRIHKAARWTGTRLVSIIDRPLSLPLTFFLSPSLLPSAPLPCSPLHLSCPPLSLSFLSEILFRRLWRSACTDLFVFCLVYKWFLGYMCLSLSDSDWQRVGTQRWLLNTWPISATCTTMTVKCRPCTVRQPIPY